MSRTKKILLSLLTVFVAIQFLQPTHNVSDKILQTDFVNLYAVPDNVRSILKTACYDCHSNNTRYPWYSHIQPIAWFMANHVKEGKQKLNFSDFGSYSSRQQISKMKAICNQIKDDEMPISSYRLMHKSAVLDTGQKKIITEWMSNMADSLLNH